MTSPSDNHDGLEGNEREIMTMEQVQQASKTSIIAYINDRTKDYKNHKLKGLELFEYGKADFENFDAATYKKSTEATRILRDFLLLNGVYIPTNRKAIADNLIASSKAWTPWPVETLHEVNTPLEPRQQISPITPSIQRSSESKPIKIEPQAD